MSDTFMSIISTASSVASRSRSALRAVKRSER